MTLAPATYFALLGHIWFAALLVTLRLDGWSATTLVMLAAVLYYLWRSGRATRLHREHIDRILAGEDPS